MPDLSVLNVVVLVLGLVAALDFDDEDERGRVP